MTKEHYIVFGASEKVSKLFVTTEEHGMKCVKIYQLKDTANKSVNDTNVFVDDIEGIYTTLYFAKAYGKETLKIFISVLQKLLNDWKAEEDNGGDT